MVIYKGEETDSSSRKKVMHNKTLMAFHLKKIPELPELEQLPTLEKPANQGENKKLLGLFSFGKKKQAQESQASQAENAAAANSQDMASAAQPEKPIAELPRHVEEPEFLKEIDLEHHSRKVEPELALWLNDGRTAKSLDELRDALKTMSNKIFRQHHDKKDLAEWVRDLVGNSELAAKLEKAESRKEAIRLIEENRQQLRRKHKEQQKVEKAKAETAQPMSSAAIMGLPKEPVQEHIEIQAAIQEAISTKRSPEKLTPEQRERQLEENERILDMEEEHLNRKRIELADRRYELIKMQGDIEKEKFEALLKKHKSAMQQYSPEDMAMPELTLTQEYTKEKIESMIEEAKRQLSAGNAKAAEGLKKELKAALEIASLTPEEAKSMEYDILELEADIKLAALAY